MTKKEQAFTIVELLIIIVIISILAGMSIFGFSNWRQSMATNEVKNDLVAIASGMESTRNFSNGYPTSLPTSYKKSPNVTATWRSGDSTQYCIDAVSKQYSTIAFKITNIARDPAAGTC